MEEREEQSENNNENNAVVPLSVFVVGLLVASAMGASVCAFMSSPSEDGKTTVKVALKDKIKKGENGTYLSLKVYAAAGADLLYFKKNNKYIGSLKTPSNGDVAEIPIQKGDTITVMALAEDETIEVRKFNIDR